MIMKQKQESKIATLCRLVAVYNDMLCAKDQYEDKISVSIAYHIGVRLHVGEGINKRAVYTGGPDGAISAVAVRMCELSNLPRVAVDVMF
jgi:hypothetical protein